MAGGAVQSWPVRVMRMPKDRPWTEAQARQDLEWWAEQGRRPGLRALAKRWHWTGDDYGRRRVRAFLRGVASTPPSTPPPAAQVPVEAPRTAAQGRGSHTTQGAPKARTNVHRGEAVTADEPPGRAQDRWARQHEPQAGDPVELARAAYWAMVEEPGRDRSKFTEATYRVYAALAVTARVLMQGGHAYLTFKGRDAREVGPCASKAQAVERAILLMSAELRPAPPRVRSGP